MRLPPPFEQVPVRYEPVAIEPDLVELTPGLWVRNGESVIDLDVLAVRVVGTDHVTVDIRDQARARAAGAVDLLPYGAVARALHVHDGRFCLHASLVTWQDATIVVAGHSGAGKSTTVTWLAQTHGARLRIDDVVPLTLDGPHVVAHPYPRPVHLFPDALERLGTAPHPEGRTVGEGEHTKHSLDLSEACAPIALTGMVLLTRRDDGGPPLAVREVTGAERLRLVVRASNSSGFASYGERAERYVEWSIAVASRLPVLEIDRDPIHDTLDEVGRTITEWVHRLRS